jgi:Ser/Thr protein kinase RdoA (MazF antagonist)
MLREYHDATAGFPLPGPWRLPAHEPAEVICHNDFAPYNLVFRDGRPAGAIDFDAASPGPRVWDLAYLAYRLVPLTAPENPDVPLTPEATRAARLAALCAAYGGPSPADVLATVPPRLDELAALGRHAEIYRRDAEHLRAAE